MSALAAPYTMTLLPAGRYTRTASLSFSLVALQGTNFKGKKLCVRQQSCFLPHLGSRLGPYGGL